MYHLPYTCHSGMSKIKQIRFVDLSSVIYYFLESTRIAERNANRQFPITAKVSQKKNFKFLCLGFFIFGFKKSSSHLIALLPHCCHIFTSRTAALIGMSDELSYFLLLSLRMLCHQSGHHL